MSGLVEQIEALLSLDARNALVPHGIGGLARELLTRALTELQHRREAEAGFADAVRLLVHDIMSITPQFPSGERVKDSVIARLEALAASPSSPASGVLVTEAMLDKALIAQHENDPAWKKRYDATAIRLRTEDMTRALIAALGEHP